MRDIMYRLLFRLVFMCLSFAGYAAKRFVFLNIQP